MSRFVFAVTVAALILASKAPAAVLSLDNFEEYGGSNSTVIGSNSSTPAGTFTWQETGSALSNPLTATNGSTTATTPFLIDGLASAYVKVNFASATFETLRYLLPAGEKNLSSYSSESITAKSTLAATATQIELFLTDGNTTFVSKTASPLGTTAAPFTFALDAADVTATVGSEAFATVVGNATSIGVELLNPTAASTTETVAIDDLQVASAVPEPATAGVLLMVFGATALRRRNA